MDQSHVVDLSVLIMLVILMVSVAIYYREPATCDIDPILERLRQDMIKVDPRLAKAQWFPGTESYTEGKRKIFICLKDEHGNYFPMNELQQVALHEAAHFLSPVIDKEHKTPEFNNLHFALRKRASQLGLFDPSKPVPPTYCPSNG